MLVGMFKVRRNASLTATYVTGDGKGSENAIACSGATHLVLYVFVDEPASVTDYRFMVEFYAGMDEPYRETVGDAGVPDVRTKIEFRLQAGQISGDSRLAIVTPIRGRMARVSALSNFGGTAPVASICAATVNTLGGEGSIQGMKSVRKAAAMTALQVLVPGDGKGAENDVPIRMSDRVVLQVDANLSATAQLNVYQDWSLDGLDYYRETAQSGTSPVDVYPKVYVSTYLTFGTAASTDGRAAIVMDAYGAWARYSFESRTALAGNVACRAIAGRG